MHEQTAEDAIAKISIQKRENKMTEKRQKGKLAEEMATLTDEANKTKKEKEEEERKKATAKAKGSGKRSAKEIIEGLPARIKEAAKKGDTSVYEWHYSGNEAGGFMFSCIGQWAREQGFDTKFRGNCEGANEGQADMDYLTISWGNKNDI